MSSTASLPAYLLPGVPVLQPPHLEGDASFATEILPGPPPIASVQSSILKRDPKKPATMYSYLPASDPGTTYSGIMHGTLIGQDVFGQRKRATDKSNTSMAVGRAQRAEARSQNVANSTPSAPDPTSTPNELAPESQPPSSLTDTDAQNDRSSLTFRVSFCLSPAYIGTQDKGKAKEVEPITKGKDESRTNNLYASEQNPNLLNNNDHCSACRSQGALVYCDGCPRAFHLWCLDPPIQSIDEGDSSWYCPACVKKPKPKKSPRPTFLDPVIQALENTIPTEFQLPDDVRTFFKDVGTSPKGAYVDTSEIKPPRLNRHGQLEDRDAHRLRDRNGQPVLCFRCGMSALPENVAATAPSTKRARKATEKALQYEVWKDMISCDYCSLHWHLDCLDPPLSSMPSFTKRWMCPNHAEKIIPSKRRIPKQNVTPIEITKTSQWNNGNIDVLESDISPPANPQKKVAVDEVLINGRRYRVPERIILLDFWNKLNKGTNSPKDGDDGSGMSSPLTSLSSLEEDDMAPPPASRPGGSHDLQAAQMLFDFHKGNASSRAPSASRNDANGITVKKEPAGIVSLPLPNTKTATTKTPKTSKATSSKRSTAKAPVNGTQASAGDSAAVTAPPAKRRRSTAAVPVARPTRELRSRSKNLDKNRQFGEEETLSTPPLVAATVPPTSKSRARVNIKMEEPDVNLSLTNGAETESVSAPVPAKKPAKRTRTTRKKDTEETAAEEKPKEKRTRKRKERDDDAYIDSNASKTTKDKSSRTNQRQVPPSTTSLSSLSTVTMTPATTSASTPATPSLKIRLPRLNLHGSPVVTTTPKATVGSSTRLS
ncbi:hypothetical protein AAF712_001497 [Marasmius tenuissimus]|uniref:PHD-type domain-containing protein n=1 Tax=Marasmius tenuissimus TaxID=585030 RepID=A0ABR3ACF3_9AGAR